MVIKNKVSGGTTHWVFEEDNLEIEFNLVVKEKKKLESSIFVNGYGPFKHSVNDYITSFTVGNDEYKIVLPNIFKGQNHRHLYRNNIDVMNGQKFSFKKKLHKAKWTMVYVSCVFGVGLAYYVYKSKKINKCKTAKFKIYKDKEYSESRNDVSYHKNLLNRGLELKKQISMIEINNSNSNISSSSSNSNSIDKQNEASVEIKSESKVLEAIKNEEVNNISTIEVHQPEQSESIKNEENVNSNNNESDNKQIIEIIENNNESNNLKNNEDSTTINNNESNNNVDESTQIQVVKNEEESVDESASTTVVQYTQDDAKIKTELDKAILSDEIPQSKDSINSSQMPKEEEESKESNSTASSSLIGSAAPEVNEEKVLNSTDANNNIVEISNDQNDA